MPKRPIVVEAVGAGTVAGAGAGAAPDEATFSHQTTMAALSAAGYDNYDPALTASNPPVFPTTPLESSLHPTTASNTPSTASSSSSASATVPVLLAVTDYGANNLFANTQFDPDSLVSGGAEAGASGALGDYLGLGEQNNTVIPGVVSDAGDISVEGIPTGRVGGVAAVEGGGRGSKRSSSNAGGGEGKEDGEGDEGSGGDANSKPLKNTKRAAQNRAAQRAFRERKEQHVRDLEAKAASADSAVAENALLTARVSELETGLASSASSATTFTVERDGWAREKALWDEERKRWERERDQWKIREGEWRRECEGLKGALEESRRQNTELRFGGSGGEKRARMEEVEGGEGDDEAPELAGKRAKV